MEIKDGIDVDDDNNGLIEIHSIDMLNNIRYNLAGTGYKTSATTADDHGDIRGASTSSPPASSTCSTTTNLCGYELTADIEFDVDDTGLYTCSNLNDLRTCSIKEEKKHLLRCYRLAYYRR